MPKLGSPAVREGWQQQIWWPLCSAVRLLSRLPFPQPGGWSGEVQGRAVLFYPLVGMVIGGLVVLPLWLLGDTLPMLAAALATLLWVWLTGGLHLDGVADMADGWIGGLGNPQRTLEIMKDPHIGPAGVMSLVMLLLLKFTALHALLTLQLSLWAVVLAPMLARLAVGLLFLTTPYVSRQGMGQAPAHHLPKPWLVVVLALAWLGPLLLQSAFWPMQGTVILVWWLIRASSHKRIGGFTGDVAGALVEWSEVSMLVVLTSAEAMV
ncbi:adenosylcobinamide-GDP ribazoletransferase [Magnetococcus marinus]|uniref:adenosylcobinamide-GDP ribazoletransferase n=1 Tax=Magnetococcus marinus TaxID=1124597 RepID=UPI00135F138D|nr:adenosylcobinamide-GDP ribazoletransferase [Magnetococcus marinus]